MTDPHDQIARATAPTSRYAVIAIVAGALFALIAILHVPGIWYAVVAILVGLSYSLVAVLSRGRAGGRNRERRRR